MPKVTRLFNSLKPKQYTLAVDIDKKNLSFSGSVVIEGFKAKPSKRITLHQKDLTILSASISRNEKNNSKVIDIIRINTQKKYDEVRLHTEDTLFPGSYTISLTFSGLITPQMNGIYPCDFKVSDVAKQLIATQFESHHARELFPCIDEPEAKATFDLTLVTEVDEAVIANTPVLSEEIIDVNYVKKLRTRFHTTPIMSTYLLAFVTGELGYKESMTKHGVTIRAYATQENVEFTDFALDTAVKVLDFYTDYFEIPYPLQKCDMIALPDFSSGAMENWGCITYRETCMLVDPDNTSLSSKQFIAMVVAHELAHQWFGNLVTMKWWTDLWLNEGFATWIEFVAVDKLFPEWEMWTQFTIDQQQSAKRLDALKNTHPVEVSVDNPNEIRTIFDAISYNKGASVIHMLCNYLGTEVFRKGLVHYLKKHSYSNTVTKDLWSALEEVSNKPVKSFMSKWTSLPGFPLVTYERLDSKIALSQERFLYKTSAKNDEIVQQTWPIPLLSSQPLAIDLLTKHKQNINLPKNSLTSFINFEQKGFYRSIYDDKTYKEIKPLISSNTLSPIDRLSVLADLFESSKAGFTSTVRSLELLKAYNNESHLSVWDIIVAVISDIRRVMDSDEVRDLLKPFIRSFVDSEVQRLGWDEKLGEKHTDTLLRPLVLGLSAGADHPETLPKILSLFDNAKKPSDITPDLRGVVYGASVRHGGKEVYDKLKVWRDAEVSAEEKDTLSVAMSGFEQSELIAKYLELTTTKEVRLQDITHWLAYSATNRHAKKATWDWARNNWTWLCEQIGTDMSYARLPLYLSRSFSSQEFLDEYDAFYDLNRKDIPVRNIKQGHEHVEWQLNWHQRDYSSIIEYLRNL